MKFNKLLKVNLNIGGKIKASFLILIGVIILTGVYTSLTLRESINVLNRLSNEVNPTIETIHNFKAVIKDSKTYTTNWVYIKGYEKDKEKLRNIHQETYPALVGKLKLLFDSVQSPIEYKQVSETIVSFEQILVEQQSVMESLNNALAYEDAMTLFIDEDLVEATIIPTCDQLIETLDLVLEVKNQESVAIKDQMQSSFSNLSFAILVLGIFSAVFALIIANWLASNITKPMKMLQDKIRHLCQGIIPEKIDKIKKDEIGDMSNGINALIDSIKSLSEFATQIGHGNLNANFTALSEKDVLGRALVSMRDNLKKVIDETNDVVRAAGTEGKLESKIDILGKEGAWRDLSEAINHLLYSIATPILEVNKIVTAMAEGDLTHQYTKESNGDIQILVNNLNKASNNLNELLNSISRSAGVVEDSSTEMLNASEEMYANTGEIASAIGEMSSGAQNQVVKVDEASNLVEGIRDSANEMEKKAETINEAAKSGVLSSEKGRVMVENVAKSMHEISIYSHKTNDSIKVLTERSVQITQVLGVITEIASQTNLLALNAAIEAAQAGDAGRGFAVVAEEIRKLAQDSRKSAQEIEKLINDVKDDTQKAAQVIETMNKSVKTGDEASMQASAVFQEIAASTNRTLSYSEEIVRATKTQQADIVKVVSITESVVVIAEETAAGTEQIASSATELSSGMENYRQKSEQLTQLAAVLKNGISKFKLIKINKD